MKVTATTTRLTAIEAALLAVTRHHTVVEIGGEHGEEWEVKTLGRWPGVVTESVRFLGSDYSMQEPLLSYGDGFVDVEGIEEAEDQIDQYLKDQADLFHTMLSAARCATPTNPMTITITTGSGVSVYGLSGGLRASLAFEGQRGAWCDVHASYAVIHEHNAAGSIIESWESRLPWLHPNFRTSQIIPHAYEVRRLMPQFYQDSAPPYEEHDALIEHFTTLCAEACIELEAPDWYGGIVDDHEALEEDF